VIGRKLSLAKTKIRAKHCRVGKLTYVKSTTRRKGRVILERPAAGKRLKNGTQIKLWIGRGPRRV
jgi:beta-lactam-binding protein with PASTA domain